MRPLHNPRAALNDDNRANLDPTSTNMTSLLSANDTRVSAQYLL